MLVEFVIILNGTIEDQIFSIVDRLIQALNIQLEKSLSLSVSIGILLHPTNTNSSRKLLQFAVKAMYKAMYKAMEQGKQLYCWH